MTMEQPVLKLRVVSSPDRDVAREFDLSTTTTTTIGRAASNRISLNDTAASAHHAEVQKLDLGLRITDLDSTNGTTVNGQRVSEPITLHAGDRIKIGETEFQVTDINASHQGNDTSGLLNIFTSRAVGDAEEVGNALPHLTIAEEEPDRRGDSRIDYVLVDSGSSKGSSRLTLETLMLDADVSLDQEIDEPATAEDQTLAERKLLLIQTVSEKLVRALDPNELAGEIMEIVIEQTRADRGLLCLLDQNRLPVPIAAHGFEDDHEVRVSQKVLKRLLDERHGLVINRSRETESSLQSLDNMQVSSTLCVPLWMGQSIHGLLSVDILADAADDEPEERMFSTEDLELLIVVAHQSAVGIERSRLNEQREHFKRFFDPRVFDEITGSGRSIEQLQPTLREVTILFADIVSFTKMSEQLDPGEVAEFVGRYMTTMTEIIFSFEGTIDKYIGDEIMALFGAPVANNKAAELAVRAALEMRKRAATDFKMLNDPTRDLQLRIGINTGRAVVGNLGSRHRAEYTAIGDAVNVAARLEQFARPGEICIDPLTRERLDKSFDVKELGTIDVKNRAEPVIVYNVNSWD